MRGEDQARVVAQVGRKTLLRRAHVRGVGLDEQPVIEPAPDERDVDVPAAGVELVLRGGHVLTILLAAGIRMVWRSDEPDGVPHAVRMHLPERLRQQRMPVAHADIHGQRPSGVRKPVPQSLRLAACQLGNWRDAVEELVMVRDFFDALGRDPPPAQHVGEERTNVVASLGAAEGHDQD